MKKLIVIAILALGWYGNIYFKDNGSPFTQGSITTDEPSSMTKCITKEGEVIYGRVPDGTVCDSVEPVKGSLAIVSSDYFGYEQGDDAVEEVISSRKRKSQTSKYSCSGKQHCSQMTSCEEATFYQNNCPGTKMDGDGDGIPCERQLCSRW